MIISSHSFRKCICRDKLFPGLSAIGGFTHAHAHHIKLVLIFGVNPYLTKYPAISAGERFEEIMYLSHLLPVLAFVSTSVYRTTDHHFLHLSFITIGLAWFGISFLSMVVHECIHHIGVGMTNRQTNPSGHFCIGQSFIHDLPGLTTVC